MRQQDMVLAHLRRRGKITPLEALDLYDCSRLAHVIFKLRQWHKIKTVPTGVKRYATYHYEGAV